MLVCSACEHLLHLLDGRHTDGIVASGGCRHSGLCSFASEPNATPGVPGSRETMEIHVSIQNCKSLPVYLLERGPNVERKHREGGVDRPNAPQ